MTKNTALGTPPTDQRLKIHTLAKATTTFPVRHLLVLESSDIGDEFDSWLGTLAMAEHADMAERLVACWNACVGMPISHIAPRWRQLLLNPLLERAIRAEQERHQTELKYDTLLHENGLLREENAALREMNSHLIENPELEVKVVKGYSLSTGKPFLAASLQSDVDHWKWPVGKPYDDSANRQLAPVHMDHEEDLIELDEATLAMIAEDDRSDPERSRIARKLLTQALLHTSPLDQPFTTEQVRDIMACEFDIVGEYGRLARSHAVLLQEYGGRAKRLSVQHAPVPSHELDSVFDATRHGLTIKDLQELGHLSTSAPLEAPCGGLTAEQWNQQAARPAQPITADQVRSIMAGDRDTVMEYGRLKAAMVDDIEAASGIGTIADDEEWNAPFPSDWFQQGGHEKKPSAKTALSIEQAKLMQGGMNDLERLAMDSFLRTGTELGAPFDEDLPDGT